MAKQKTSCLTAAVYVSLIFQPHLQHSRLKYKLPSPLRYNDCDVSLFCDAQYVFLPSFRFTLAILPRPITDLSAKFTSLPTHGLKDPFPQALRGATLDLASNNLICSVALTGVLALQAGRFWAEKGDPDEDDSSSDSEHEEVKPRESTPLRESRSQKSKGRTRVPT